MIVVNDTPEGTYQSKVGIFSKVTNSTTMISQDKVLIRGLHLPQLFGFDYSKTLQLLLVSLHHIKKAHYQ